MKSSIAKRQWGIFAIIVVVVSAVAIKYLLYRPVTLVDLQKQYLFAKTDTEKEKVIDRLEKYYLNLAVPDTISKRVDTEVATILDTTRIDLSACTNDVCMDSNVYRVEDQLQGRLYLAAIACARDENQLFKEIVSHAKYMAQSIDGGTQNNYWKPFVEKMGNLSKEGAMTWLKAQRAAWLCWFYQDNAIRFFDVERYAALGLRSLQQVSDERTQLDIMQRLQYVLYFHRSMIELSVGLGQRSFPMAKKIKYHLRANGLVYHQAEAISSVDQYPAALTPYDTVIENAMKFVKIRKMEWFAYQGLLGKGKVFVETGEFERAIDACNDAEKYELDTMARIRLLRLRSDIYRSTANYEQAEKEIRKAATLAESTKDTFNLILSLNSLGALFHELKLLDVASDYYNQSRSLFTSTGPDLSTRMRVYNNIASIAVTKNDAIQFEKISREAKEMLGLVTTPFQEAQLSHGIGSLYKRAKKYDEALHYLQQADSIYTTHGFLRFALEARIDLMQSLMGLSRFDEAEARASEIERLAWGINDVEKVIDVIGHRARIYYAKNDVGGAVAISNRLIKEIENLSSRFSNPDLLMAYRQKIYDFLKEAVFYEIERQGFDSAFVKLDYAKAYALRSQLIHNHGNKLNHSAEQRYLDIQSIFDKLQEGSLIIDYLVTEDRLYAFALNHQGLQVVSKIINAEVLRKTVTAYSDSIQRTKEVIRHYDVARVNSHYAGTIELAQELYQVLLEWPELKSRLQQAKIVYIIADEFLHEVPFATLIANRSDARTFAINHYAVATVPSARFLEVEPLAHVSQDINKMRVLISVDRQFDGAEGFVSKVKTIFPLAEELSVQDGTFTKDEILAEFKKDYRIFIFLGHGSANQKYPDRSYIQLFVKSPDAASSKLIRLSLADLKEIKWLGMELVMLIGCETAGGRLYRGTGIWGLHQGFLYLGAQHVLGNLWEVDDNKTITQAQDFLDKWKDTWNPYQALQVCQRNAIRELEGHIYYQQPHPSLWGSSILLTARQQ